MIRRSDRTRYDRFARQLLQAMGIGSLASLAVAGAACGGSVAVEKTGSTAGAGGGTTTGAGGASTSVTTTGVTSTTTTGAGGGFNCQPSPPPGSTVVYACLDNPPAVCEPKEAQAVHDQLDKQLDGAQMGCGQTMRVSDVPCGPDPHGKGCCYVAVLSPQFCEGRPFTVEGVARTALVAGRDDWREEASPALGALDAATRQALAEAWGRDGLYEHASIASFARFTLELMAAGAPASLLGAAQRAMGDEIRHAELCFGLASAYGGAPVGPGRMAMAGALVGRDDLASIAAATAREGCIGETLAALAASAARDAAEDRAVRAALDGIAGDEAAHAHLAWRFVSWALQHGGADVRAAVEAVFAEPGGEVDVAAFPRGADPAAMRAHGRLPAGELRELAARAHAEVIRPCAQAMLAASAGPVAAPSAQPRA